MTTPPSALPPANWYPDPQTPGQLRYWDGQRWTPHVHPLQQQPAQAASGYVNPEPQAAINPLAQAIQQSQTSVYTPVLQPSPTMGGSPGVQAAGPATGGTFLPTGQQAAAGAFPTTGATPTFPATGATPTFPTTGSIGTIQPGATASSPGMLQAPRPREFDDEPGKGDGLATAPLTAISAVLGIGAFGVTALAIFGLGTDFDQYFPYVGAGLGFLAVLFGFLGRRKASASFMGGVPFAWAGISAGFLAMLLSTYEIMYPGELYAIFSDYL